MLLIPVESPERKRARKVVGAPAPKIFGLPKWVIFKIAGFLILAIGLISSGWITSFIGSGFDNLSIYSVGGRWVLVGIAAIIVLGSFKEAHTAVALG